MIKRIGALVFAFTLLFAFAVPASADYDSSYTYYDYLKVESNGYVDTKFKVSSDSRIVIDFSFPTGLGNDYQNNYWLFGATDGTSRTVAYLSWNGSDFYLVVSAGNSISLTASYVPNSTNTLDIDFANNSIVLNGTLYSYSFPDFESTVSLYLFGYNSTGTFTRLSNASIYSCRLYDNGTLNYSYIPARNSAGTYGMWDLVTNSFSPLVGSGTVTPGDIFVPSLPDDEPSVAEKIESLNTQIHDIESAIYDDLHIYSAQVDPSTATNFSGNFLSAMSFISDTWTSAYNQLGDMQVIVTFPLFLAIAMLFIGRMNSVIASGAMKSRKNNDKKGGGDVG